MIVRARFGLDGDEPQTLECIGKKLGLTRQRVRQILAHILIKLKKRIGQRRQPIPA
jgi:DNA-directed RNA polymerase sigma subunit (sigma70/sigma32)